jgi:hypothetical protein
VPPLGGLLSVAMLAPLSSPNPIAPLVFWNNGAAFYACFVSGVTLPSPKCTIVLMRYSKVSPMTYVQWIGYVAAGLGIVTFAMQTMIPLRVTGIAHNLGQIAFGLLAGVYPTVIQHVVLLPINCYRLIEMCSLIKKVQVADHSFDWLRPFMSKRSIKAGEILCRKGERASDMYFILKGVCTSRRSTSNWNPELSSVSSACWHLI